MARLSIIPSSCSWPANPDRTAVVLTRGECRHALLCWLAQAGRRNNRPFARSRMRRDRILTWADVWLLAMSQLLADSDSLAAFCARQQGAAFVTVDTEFIRDRTYWPRL